MPTNPFFSHFNVNSIFESLEDRVLFDGVPDATFIMPQNDVEQPVPAQVQDLQSTAASAPRELIIVDPGVEDAESLLAEVLENRPDSTFEVRILDADQDGVAQISELLQGDQQYSAIHIISHGDEGEVQLGNSTLTADNLNQYVDQLAGWADALTEDADLLFYGCDLASNAEGEQFIESISAITGADVAASDDLTGAADLGGDWELELNVGTIETQALASTSFAGVLMTDTDGDGIDDADDADKDGDGILNVDEGLESIVLESGRFPAGSAPVAVNGGDQNNLATGDIFVFPGAFGGFDLRFEITEVNTISAEARLNDNGTLLLEFTGDNEISYIVYDLSVVEIGSVQADPGLVGITVPITNAEVFIGDIDARNGRDFSDIGGVNTSSGSTPDSLVVGSELSVFDYPAGVSAAAFDTFGLTNLGTGNPDRNEPDFGVSALYSTFESGSFLHGVDGVDGDGNRGAVFAFSGELPRDVDGDGIYDHCDLDSDNDGISDLVESGNALAIAADTDGDGVVSAAEATAANFTDSDGDGVYDQLGTAPVDTDNDGIADYLDLDSDNDGIPDAVEAQPTDGYIAPNGSDVFIPEDTDGDGVADYLDTDSDNDGIDDTTESGLPLTGTDANGDGIDDGVNASYADPDGDVNDPINDLTNSDNNPSDADYRSIDLTPLPDLQPHECGGVLAEAYLLDGLGIGGEQSYQLASGIATHDPDVFFGVNGAEHAYTKNADGSVDFFFDGEAPVASITSDISVNGLGLSNIATVAGSAADQTDAAEFWRVAVRIDGVPGETYTYNLDNGDAHEFIHFWAEDSSGNVIDSSLGDPNTANGWIYGTGAIASTSGPNPISAVNPSPISYTIPASSTDGIVYLNVLVLDPQVGFGRLNFIGDVPECPHPEIAVAKEVAGGPTLQSDGSYAVTYEVAVENTGDFDLGDVSLVENLVPQFGSAFVSAGNPRIGTPPSDPTSVIALNSGWDGSANTELIDNSGTDTHFQAGDSFTILFDVIVDASNTTLTNQVEATGTAVNEDGTAIVDVDGVQLDDTTDLSDSGADPDSTNAGADGDTGGSDDPTPLTLPETPDKDWDGVPDAFDLDQDGDGILDADEGRSVSQSTDDLVFPVTPNVGPGTTPVSGVVSSVGFENTPSAPSGTFTATDVRFLNSDANVLRAQFYSDAQQTAANNGEILLELSEVDQTTLAGSQVTGSTYEILDFDSDNVTFQLELFDESGNTLTNLTNVDVIVSNGTGALTGPTSLGGGIFEFNVSSPTDFHNTAVSVVSSNGLVLSGIRFTGTSLNDTDAFAFVASRQIETVIELDTDGDGVPDHCDPDSDNDGISDLLESGNALAIAADTDGSGVIDDVEAAAAGFTDADGDGAWDQLGAAPVDTDGDGIADFRDLDSDADGIPDAVEAQTTAGYQSPSIGSDTDGDGVVDTFDDPSVIHGAAFTPPVDTDGDGVADFLDTDSDNDGIDDTTESGLPLTGTDADGDGIDDGVNASYADPDGDVTDPINDLENGTDNDPRDADYRSVDLPDKDWDGVADIFDADQDGDGILDIVESPPAIGSITAGDDTANPSGVFANELGVEAAFDIVGGDPAIGIAERNAGVTEGLQVRWNQGSAIDYDLDLTIQQPTGGILDSVRVASAAPGTNNGLANASKFVIITWQGSGSAVLSDPLGEITSHADGAIIQSGEQFLIDSGLQLRDSVWSLDIDVSTVSGPVVINYESEIAPFHSGGIVNEGFAFIPVILTDTDGDGIHDGCDFDSDNDGISDLVESGNALAIDADTDGSGVIDDVEAAAAGFTDADGDGAWDELGTAAPADSDGDGVFDFRDLDSDDDGIADAIEAQPTTGYQSPAIGSDADGDGIVDTFDDPAVEHGGAFTAPVDSDWDGTPDYLDTDSDNDGIDDTTESGLTLSGTDADGDGIDDGVAPDSYADTDGIVSDPSSDLDNETADTFEVAYREVAVTIGVAKDIVGQPVAQPDGTFAVTYEVVVENTGLADLINLSVVEDLATEFGPAFGSASNLTLSAAPADPNSSIAINSAWDGSGVTEFIDNSAGTSLVVGDSFSLQFDVIVNPTNSALDNQVVASGAAVDHDGNPILDGSGKPVMAFDDSDSGTDPNGNNPGEDGDTGGSDDPTPLYLPGIGLAKEASTPVPNGNHFDVTFTLNWENTGNVALDGVEIFDDIAAQFGPQFIGATIDSVTTSGTATLAANGAWAGNTAQSLITHSGDDLAPGDTVQVDFTVTIDPSEAPIGSSGLENQATSTGTGVDPDTGMPDADLMAMDTSDNGVDPTGENGSDEDGDGAFANDPTPFVLPNIGVAKSVVSTTPNGDNFDVVYQLVVENTGNVDLADISLDDAIAMQFGAAFVNAGSATLATAPTNADSSITLDATWNGDTVTEFVDQTVTTNLLKVGDSFVVEFTVTVDPDATGTSGPLDNQATAEGDAVDSMGNPLTDSSGNPLVTMDLSDNGADPNGDNGGGTSDDPTPLLLPDLRVGKQANSVTPVAGLNSVFDVEYIVVIENTGTIELTDLQIVDDVTLLTNFGDAYNPTFIGTGTTDRTGLVALPTVVSHTLANAGDLPNFDASFLGGGGQTGVFDGTSGVLQTGEQIMVTYTVRIDGAELLNGPDGTTAPNPGNQVQGSADSDLGPVDDDSDDGLNPNTDNGEGTTNDPTPFEIPQVRLWKAHSDAVSNGDGTSTITVTLRVENTGTVDLTNLSLNEDIDDQFGDALVSTTLPTIDATLAPTSNIPAGLINAGWVNDTSQDLFNPAVATELLAPGEEFSVTFDVTVDPDLLDDDSDYLTNTATVTGDGQNFDGSTIAVEDQSGIDTGTGFDSDEPTVAIVPEIAVAKIAGDAVPNGDNFDVTFTLIVENTGSINLDMLTLFDDIETEFGDAFVGITGLAVQNFAGSGTAPTANTLWQGDTMLNMLNMDGNLDPGDRFEVVFTATIDPDGIDSVSQGLTNQATVGGRGVDDMGNVLTDASGNPLMAEDLSDSGSSPQGDNTGENGDMGTSDDPTPIIIADISAAKQVVGTPTLLANGNFEAIYQVVIENTGTVDLANLTLDEDLMTQFGGAYVNAYGLTLTTPPADADSTVSLDSANWNGGANTEIVNTTVPSLLAVGDSFIFQFNVEIDAAMATGVLENTVTAGGAAVDSNGNPFTDASGAPITATDDSDSGADPSNDNPGAPGDNGTSDDPTPLLIPNLSLAKEAGDAVPNGDYFDVEFTLVWENTGTVALDGVDLFDDIATQFGSQFVGIVPGSLTVSSFAGAGSAPTANTAWEGDTTESLITATGPLEVGDTFEVTFSVTIDPDAGGTSSSGLENQATSNGTGINPDTGMADPALAASDVSDNGTDPTAENGEDNGDGVFSNDPTPIIIPDISVAKQVAGTPVPLANGNFEVTYELVIENTGNVDLANLTLVEDLAGQFGTALVSAGNITLTTPPADASSSITLDSSWDGSGITEIIDQDAATLLAVGDSFTVQFTTEVDPDAVGAPGALDNQATVGGDAVDENGNPIVNSSGAPIVVSDDSDSGADPNGDNPNAPGDMGTTDDPTPLLIPDLGLAKAASDAVPNGDNFDVTFTFVIENNGTVDMTNLSLTDDIMAEFGNAFVSATAPTVANFVGTGTAPGANALWAGDSTQDLLDGTGQLNIGDRFEVSFTVTIDPDGMDSVSQALENQGTIAGDGINPDTGLVDPALAASDVSDNGADPDGVLDDATPIIIADVSAAKQVIGTPTLLSNGNYEAVYQVVIENTGTVDLANLTLTEDLATQFGGAYVNAYNLTLTTPPADADSAITLDTANFNGGSSTEIVNTNVPSALAVGDSFIFEFSVEIDVVAASGVLENTVTVTGDAVDENGDPLTDSTGAPITATDDSDSGADPSDPNSNAPGDNGTSDDPTPLLIPSIGLAKQAGDAVPNGENFDVEFTLVWENTGTVALDGVELFDDIAAQFGAQLAGVTLDSINFTGTGSAPILNADWEADTTRSLITSTGPLNVDDTFEVVFTVTIDPDATGTSPGLENQATSTGTGINPDTGAPDPALVASDDSDNGADPSSENGEDNGDGTFGNDPTPIIIPDISVVKEVVSTAPNGDNFDVVYRLVVENTGSVDLANVSLIDDIATQFGGAFVSAGSLTFAPGGAPPAGSSITLDTGWDGDATSEAIDQSVTTNLLQVGHSFTVEITVTVDPDASGTSGSLNNQATVGGDAVDDMGNPLLDSSGSPLMTTDLSDNGADPNGDNGEGGTDDATPLLLPDLRVAKQANTVTPVANLSGVFDIEYIVVIENTGTIELTNLQITDDITLPSNFGDAYTPNFIGTGTLDRTGFVAGPSIVSHTLANPGDLPSFNAGFLGGPGATTIFDANSGALQTGEQIAVTYTVRIDTLELTDGDATDAPEPGNQIQGTADSAEGMVSDISDDGLNPNTDNGDGTSNDPTPFEVPQIRLWKAHSDAVTNGDGTSTITVTLRVANTGTVDLSNLSLNEDLETQFDSAFVSATMPTIDATLAPTSTIPANLINPAWTGDTSRDLFNPNVTTETLVRGEEFSITFDVVVDPDLLDDDSDYLTNTATVAGDGQNFNGSTISVDDQSGTDNGDGFDNDEPTPAIVPEIAVVKSAGDAVPNGDDFDVTFTLVVENTGSTSLDMLTLFDDVANEFGNAFVAIVPGSLAVQNFAGAGTAPTANVAWEGNSANLLNMDGNLDPGDRFEVVFAVTIDPDGMDSVSQGLTNQATAGGRGVDELGNVLTDSSGTPLMATDDSDSGTSPQGNNPDENGDLGTSNDPTPIIIADIGAAKQVAGTPIRLANGNYETTYQVIIENIGTVDLANLTISEDIAFQFGGAYINAYGLTLITPPADPSSTVTLDSAEFNGGTSPGIVDASAASLLAVGDSFVFEFSVEIDLTQATATLENTVTAGGDAVDANGNPLTDSSGNPITAQDDSDSGTDGSDNNAGAPGDMGTSDDPTPLVIPEVGLAKSAGDAVPNGDNFDVTFTFIYENTGNVDLANLSLVDDIAAEFGNAFVGVVPGSLAVQNFVGTGTAPGANVAWEGNTSLNLLDGTGQANIDDTFEVVFTVTIDPDGIDGASQGLENQGTAGGVGINPDTGAPDPNLSVTDESDNGSDPNGGDTPTPIIIADVSVAKEVFGTPVPLPDGRFEVTYQLVVENTGTVDLVNLSLVDNIAAQFGAPFVSAGGLTLVTPPADAGSSVTIDPSYDGSANAEIIDQDVATALAVGDSYVVQFNVVVDLDAGGTSGPLNNQAVTGGDAVDENGNPITDSSGNPITASDNSDSGADPNGDNPNDQGDMGTTDDPTPLLIPDIAIAKSAGVTVANGDNFDVTFTLVVENTGTVTLDNLSVFDDVAAQFGNAYLATSAITVQNFVGTGTAPIASGAWTADTAVNMVTGGSLDVGDSFEIVFTVTIDPDGIDSMSQALENQATAGGDGVNPDGTPLGVSANDVSDNGTDPNGENSEDNIDGVSGNDPTPIIIADLGLAKSVVGTPTLLSNGNFSVTYQVVVENTGTVDLANLSLLEDLAGQLGGGFVNAGNATITVPPAGLNSTIALSPRFDGAGDTQLVNTGVPSLLEVGDSFTFEFDVEVIANALPVPANNTVSATGDAVDQNGNPISDPSGNPITAADDSDSGTDPSSSNIGEPGDTFGSDDPTPLLIPSVGLAKLAGDAVPNGENFDVTFTLVYENNGTVDLQNLTLLDDIASEFGNAFVSASNVAVQNFSGTGTAPTVNNQWTGDTTQSIISGGTANVGDSFEVVFTITIDPNADGASTSLNNQATASGEALDANGNPLLDPSGNPITASDDSDNGTSPNDENGSEDTTDGTFGNDPTPIQIADLGIAKSTVGEPVLTDLGNFVVTFQLVIENTGTVDLANLSLLEDISTQFGTAFVDAGNLVLVSPPSDPASNIAVDSAFWDGQSVIELLDSSGGTLLTTGDSFTLQFDVEIDPREVSDPLENQVEGSGEAVDANGNPILDSSGNPITATDLSDSGADPGSSNSDDPADNQSADDPTPFDPPPVPLGVIAGTVFQDDNGDGIQQLGEAGIAGVEITLTGTDVFGNPVETSVLTDANGVYEFTELNAGTYSIEQAQPEGFTDGEEMGDSSFTIENDRMSNIQLGFGQSFRSSTFAERLPGASGNPPRLPGFLPFNSSRISNLIGGFLGGPGPIYSGTPISSSPVSGDAGLPVTGGYSVDPSESGDGIGDCGCPEPINPCCVPVDACGNPILDMPTEQMIMDEGSATESVIHGDIQSFENYDTSAMDVEKGDADEVLDTETVVEELTSNEPVNGNESDAMKRPSFLKRIANWLNV